MDPDANYHSSASGDSFDGELGRLCWGGGSGDERMSEDSDSEEEDGSLRALCSRGVSSAAESPQTSCLDSIEC